MAAIKRGSGISSNFRNLKLYLRTVLKKIELISCSVLILCE